MIAPAIQKYGFLFVLCGAAGILGFLIYRSPLVAVGIGIVSILLSVGLYFSGSVRRLFVFFLGFVLFGYAFFGRAFAYLGFTPFFVGEILLTLGIARALLSRDKSIALRSVLGWVILFFIIWGALCTLPYLNLYGIDSLRDGVVWGYSFFAILIPPLIVRTRLHNYTILQYSRLLPWFLVFTPMSWALARLFSGFVPTVPGTNVPWLALKPGDMAVHYAGIGSFLLLQLHRSPILSKDSYRLPSDCILWFLWLVCFLIVSSVNRAGFLSIIIGGSIVFLIRPGRSVRQVAMLLAVAIPFTLAIISYDVSINLGGNRSISIEQIIANVQSISGDSERNELSGSREWRLRWWDAIIDYTFRGPYFWTGKGYGINLADADGFQVSAEGALRSPHNGHLTILARSGVPGLALWVILQLLFAGALISASIRARRNGREHWVAINGWILAYWAAFLINGAFDVFLEGPQGGIWFWCVIGFGIGILQIQREEIRDPGSNLKTVAP
jgi:hypothetical protein